MSSAITAHSNTEDTEIWASLREAIANSAGFNSWKQQQASHTWETQSLDILVRRYLRETLETLAY